MLVEQSEWSRSVLKEIGDLEEKAALEYLTQYGVEEKVAIDAIHDFLGGRILHLKTAAQEYQRGKTMQGQFSGQSNCSTGIATMCPLQCLKKVHFF